VFGDGKCHWTVSNEQMVRPIEAQYVPYVPAKNPCTEVNVVASNGQYTVVNPPKELKWTIVPTKDIVFTNSLSHGQMLDFESQKLLDDVLYAFQNHGHKSREFDFQLDRMKFFQDQTGFKVWNWERPEFRFIEKRIGKGTLQKMMAAKAPNIAGAARAATNAPKTTEDPEPVKFRPRPGTFYQEYEHTKVKGSYVYELEIYIAHLKKYSRVSSHSSFGGAVTGVWYSTAGSEQPKKWLYWDATTSSYVEHSKDMEYVCTDTRIFYPDVDSSYRIIMTCMIPPSIE